MEPEKEQIPAAKPEEKKGSAFQSFIKRWGIFSYLRELSVVIIGILITLSITNLINNYNRQKDLDGMLSLVKQELYENLESLDGVQRRWEGEAHIFSVIRKNDFNIDAIPVDTLGKYYYAIGALHGFSGKTDSYDVLKASTQVQYIKHKGLLQNLSYAYSRISALNDQLTIYSEKKADYMNPIYAGMDYRDAERSMDGDAYEVFNYFFSTNGYKTFSLHGPTILSPGIFDECRDNLWRVISELEKYGY